MIAFETNSADKQAHVNRQFVWRLWNVEATEWRVGKKRSKISSIPIFGCCKRVPTLQHRTWIWQTSCVHEENELIFAQTKQITCDDFITSQQIPFFSISSSPRLMMRMFTFIANKTVSNRVAWSIFFPHRNIELNEMNTKMVDWTWPKPLLFTSFL